MRVLNGLFLVAAFCLASHAALADQALDSGIPLTLTVPQAAQANPQTGHLDVEAATLAYLAEISPTARARSDSYFEGGYWLILWDFLYGAAVALLILSFRWSEKMRALSEHITRFKSLQVFIYWAEYSVLSAALSFPLTVYESFFREHQYGLANQTFGPWFGDAVKGLMISLVLGGILMTLLFAVVRRAPKTWWVWGSGLVFLFFVFVALIGPIYLAPIFNQYTRLNDPKITEPILRIARANQIPAKDIFESDSSKQSTRMSANVSGIGSTMRITLNDNLLHRGSSEEIQAVMGHEMGHYVLNHVYKGLMFYFILIVMSFSFLKWSLNRGLIHYGKKWGIRDISDPAVLPFAILLISVLFFFLTPITNTYTRTEEIEADMFGLNAAAQPDGFAQAAIHLAEYRKMNPSPFEEWVFFDHPSGYNRIKASMTWKAEHLKP